MSVDSIFNFVVNAVRKEEQEKHKKPDKAEPVYYRAFFIERSVKSLIEPSRLRAVHHREREKYYTEQLEESEKELREKGVSVDIKDPSTGASFAPGNIVASGAISNTGNFSSIPKFEAKIDPQLLGRVEKAKSKMFDHRGKAEDYEKLTRAFSCASDEQMIRLSIDDIHFFKLES